LTLAEPRHVDGVAGVQDDDDVRIHGCDGRDEFVLPARKLEPGVLVVAAAVAALGPVVVGEDDDLVRVLRRGHGGRD